MPAIDLSVLCIPAECDNIKLPIECEIASRWDAYLLCDICRHFASVMLHFASLISHNLRCIPAYTYQIPMGFFSINSKDHIKEERLRPYDKAKHEIYKVLKEELPKAHSWDDLKDALADRDIDMEFKVSRTTREIQGVKFEYNGFSFSGSKVGREFSYLNIDKRLEENACASLLESAKQEPKQHKEEVQQNVSHTDDNFGFNLGLLNGNSSYDATAAEAEFNRLMKKKKAKRKRGFQL